MRRSLLAAAAVALLAGCGSTVQQASLGASGQPAANGDSGLGVPTAAATAGAGSGVGVGTGPAGSNGAVGGPVAAGGTTGGGGTSTPGGTGGAPTGAGGRSRINTPLKLGIAYINNQTASSALGVADPRKNQVKAVIEAYVHGINATGGLDGRKLVPVEYEWHSGDGSWSTAAASACAKFTQDNHVSVVLDEAFGTVGGFRDCLQKAGVFDITNQTVGDNAASAAATLYAGVGGLTLDRTYSAVLTGEMQSGYLHKTDHLGVIVEGCPENERAWSRSLAPLVTRLGLPAPKVVTFNCIDSTAGGATDGQAAISNAILRFRQPPTVDRVMFVSAEEAAALLLFAESASSQDYHPGYLLSSNAQAHLSTESGTGFPADQIPQLHGVGNSPYGDVNNPRPTTTDAHCLALLRRGGVSATNVDDQGQALFSCGPFLLLEAALRRTSGDATAGGLTQAVASLGASFSAPSVLGGSTSYSSSHRDGGDLVQPFGYIAGCQCIRYVGRTMHAPS